VAIYPTGNAIFDAGVRQLESARSTVPAMQVTAPQLARLIGCRRLWAYRQIIRGRFGAAGSNSRVAALGENPGR
jgi:hypothetical protein